MTKFNSVQEVVDLLNSNNVQYLILRNYQNLLNDTIYVGGHEDIDFLVKETKDIVNLLGAIPNREKEDNTHYHIFINNNKVNLDLRHVGDGYYCTDWQVNMLKARVIYNGFYVMDKENYFYSLCYHAILQKGHLSDEYLKRLNKKAEELSLSREYYGNENKLLRGLQNYMKKNNYVFTYTEDPSIPLRFDIVNKEMISNDMERKIKHQLFVLKLQLITLKNNVKQLLRQI